MSVVAIVGRPNVGKSTLFNRIIGKRKALVSDMPGVTRDRHYGQAEWCGTSFTVVDTGGLSFDRSDRVEAMVHRQSLSALAEAAAVVALFDARDGVTPLDREIVDIFRKGGKKVVYAANKIDGERDEPLLAEFSGLGIDVVGISSEHGRNIDELLDRLIGVLPPPPLNRAVQDAASMRIALVGRPNVGKSSIINRLCREERLVAHELPGTTRDSIDVEVNYRGSAYVFVDTAGIKKRSRTTEKLDKFSTLKSLRAIEDADIVFVVLDASEGFTRQDITLAAHAYNLFRPTAILLNKWDKVRGDAKEFMKETRYRFKELGDLPMIACSAVTGENCDAIFGVADDLNDGMKKRIPTSALNRFFEDMKDHHPPPDWQGKPVKLNYITQVDVRPPVFAVFANQPKGIDRSYKKYLVKGLQKLLGGSPVPVLVKFRQK